MEFVINYFAAGKRLSKFGTAFGDGSFSQSQGLPVEKLSSFSVGSANLLFKIIGKAWL